MGVFLRAPRIALSALAWVLSGRENLGGVLKNGSDPTLVECNES